MNDKLLELLLKIESLNTEDLEKVSAWIEFNINKRHSKKCMSDFKVLFLTANRDAQMEVERLLTESTQISEHLLVH